MRYQEYHSARVLNELTNNVLAPIGTLLGAGLADAQSAKKTYDRAKKSLEDSIKRTIESPSSLTKRTKQAEVRRVPRSNAPPLQCASIDCASRNRSKPSTRRSSKSTIACARRP